MIPRKRPNSSVWLRGGTQTGTTTPGQSVSESVMAMKECSKFPSTPGLEPHHQIV